MKLFIFLVLVLLISLLITYIGDVIKKSKEPIALNFKKWVFPNSAYPNWHRVIKNGYSIKMVDTGITLPTNKYSISFMYKLTALNGGHNNMFRITTTNNDCCNEGDRIRSVWINPNLTSFLLVAATNNPNDYTTFPGVSLNTIAFITFLFDNNVFSVYVNGQKTYTYTFNGLRPIPINSTLYIGDSFYPANGEINIQDFTIYDGVLTNDQINIIYNESTEQGRKKKIDDELATQLRVAEEQRAAQKSANVALTLSKLNTQLNATPNTNLVELQNIRNRITQYQSI